MWHNRAPTLMQAQNAHHTHLYKHKHTHKHAPLHTHTYARMHVRTHARTHAHTHARRENACNFTLLHVVWHVHAHNLASTPWCRLPYRSCLDQVAGFVGFVCVALIPIAAMPLKSRTVKVRRTSGKTRCTSLCLVHFAPSNAQVRCIQQAIIFSSCSSCKEA